MPDIDLRSFSVQVQNFMNIIKSTGQITVDRETFLDKVTNDESIFNMLDDNNDGKISEEEINTVLQADSDNDGIVTQNEMQCMQQMKFLVRREVDKWFSYDLDRDGHISNVEDNYGKKRDNDRSISEISMSNQQLASLYNMEEIIYDPLQLEKWLNNDIEQLKQRAKSEFGIELNERQIAVLKNEQKKQLNTWLFKTGDNVNEDSPLYCSLNANTYTRLTTTNQLASCCMGDVTPPPMTESKGTCDIVFRPLVPTVEQSEDIWKQIGELQEKLHVGEITMNEYEKEYKKLTTFENTSEEVKNRLAWAMLKTPPKEKLALYEDAATVWQDMTDEEYAQYHEQYVSMRNMKASDFRELLRPENKQKRIEFEKNSAMSVKQIVDYIDIVERQIGAGNFDNEDWSVQVGQHCKILQDINGITGDEERLYGKTRADVPENRQALLRFLEEKGWLFEQFKL